VSVGVRVYGPVALQRGGPFVAVEHGDVTEQGHPASGQRIPVAGLGHHHRGAPVGGQVAAVLGEVGQAEQGAAVLVRGVRDQ
jgi:hypothetical protein